MQIVNIHEAAIDLSRLVSRAMEGEEVIIRKASGAMVKLIPYARGNGNKPRRPGQWRGKVKIAEDFDELPEDIAAAFGGEKL